MLMKPVTIELPPVNRGRDKHTAFIQNDQVTATLCAILDQRLIVAVFWSRQWKLGVRVFMDAHESIWTQILTDDPLNIVSAPQQHETIDEAIAHARRLVPAL